MNITKMVLLTIITFIYLMPPVIGKQPFFPDYWWDMRSDGSKLEVPDKSNNIKAKLTKGVKLIRVPRLLSAARLTGSKDYIHVAVDDVKDCLAFRFHACNNYAAITTQFWIRIRGGKRILATASYTNGDTGPGILFEYNELNETMNVEFANEERVWKVSAKVVRDSWYLVIAQWQSEKGLVLILDGKYDKQIKDTNGKPMKRVETIYHEMITVGRPTELRKINEFGNFDIAHLMFYFRSLSEGEIKEMPKSSLNGDEKTRGCCERKEYDKCYTDPCSSLKCLYLEKNYTDCICPELSHPQCNEFQTTLPPNNLPPNTLPPNTLPPTTLPPTPRIDCVKNNNSVYNILGCKNVINSGSPVCGTDLCYYGECVTLKNKSKGEKTGQDKRESTGLEEEISKMTCKCPKTCRNVIVKKPVCGSDHRTYENYCIMAYVACLLKKKIVMVHEGRCSDFDLRTAMFSPKSNCRNR